MNRLVRSGAACLWIGLGILGAGPGSRVPGQEPEPRLVGSAGGMSAYTMTAEERRLSAGIETLRGDGSGADIAGMLVIQERFLDSQCGFPAACEGPCNVVQMLWAETRENTEGVDIFFDGFLLGNVPGLPADQLPGVNGIRIQRVAAGRHGFGAADAAGATMIECFFDVLDAQPFEDVSDLECRQGEVAEDGTCEILVSWETPEPFADEVVIAINGRILGAAPGDSSTLTITGAPAGEHCVEVFGVQTVHDCVDYRGCVLRTCCSLTCGQPACAPPRDIVLCQAMYGPDPEDNAVRAAWTNGEPTYAGITGLLDDVVLGTLAGDARSAAIGGLAPGPHTLGIQGDCGPPDGLSAIAEADIVIRAASPHPRPVTDAGIACSFTPDPDGEGEETSETTATWTNEDPSLFIDVFVLAVEAVSFVATIAGSETEITLSNMQPEDRIGLQFFAAVDGDCYGSPLISCGPTEPSGNTYIQGLCNGTGNGLEISSAVFFLNFLFLGGPDPPCLKACDSNGDGDGDLSDGVFVLAYLFLGGPPPPTWVDTTGDAEPDPTCISAGVDDDCETSHESCR